MLAKKLIVGQMDGWRSGYVDGKGEDWLRGWKGGGVDGRVDGCTTAARARSLAPEKCRAWQAENPKSQFLVNLA